jgi:ribonuclease HII
MMLELACGPGLVCGVDEAGRGPWAGPVSAGAVILDPDRVPKGLNDSKKLTAKARAALEEEIKAVAISWCVGMASIDEIAAAQHPARRRPGHVPRH